MGNESTVFIVQRPRPRAKDGWMPNLQPATEYGKLEFIFASEDRAYASPKEARAKASARLHSFDPSTDFICWTNFGDPACMWIVIMLLVAKGHRTLRFLYWSRGIKDGQMSNDNGYYAPIELDVN